MGEFIHWAGNLHLGKWITDNTTTLGLFLNIILVLLKWKTESKIRKEDKKEKVVEKAQVREETAEIMNKIDKNTAVTIAAAEQQGVPIQHLLTRAEQGLEEIMHRHLARMDAQDRERNTDGRSRSGGSRGNH